METTSAQYNKLLSEIFQKKCQISLLGDGEFKSVELMKYALMHGWDFNLGQSEST